MLAMGVVFLKESLKIVLPVFVNPDHKDKLLFLQEFSLETQISRKDIAVL
jgi:hypothetical protein